jgi:hypothetical protein
MTTGDSRAGSITTAQIGRCGELLVQYKLLLLGVESAPMTTDTGVDLVAFASASKRAVTIQVKANARPKPGGGKGRLALDWYIADDCPAEFTAFVDLSTSTAWLMSAADVAKHAQQHASSRYHFYLYVDPNVEVRSGRLARVGEFDGFLLERRAADVFGSVRVSLPDPELAEPVADRRSRSRP